jgi:GH15 family glucan-1,4-alpha-glucosidase
MEGLNEMAVSKARSIEIIKQGQADSGAYLACPNFPTYRYSWFRDGAYIAYAMDRVGEHESARRFHGWAARVILDHADVIGEALAFAAREGRAPEEAYLHTRYTLDGEEDQTDWPNYQLDGIGTWLWSLEQHRELAGGTLPEDWLESAGLAAAYLSGLWRYPCSDSWEEFHDRVHTYTLAAVYGGLQAAGALTGEERVGVLDEIRAVLLDEAVREGGFVKYLGSGLVDANLLGLSVPYGVVAPDDPVMAATADRIEEEIVRGNGLHRYAEDTYYGGGAWVLLSAWLGWYWAERGGLDRARVLLGWVEAQADADGELPEQVPVNLNDPAYLPVWRARWGEIARPLLWSHAKHLILREALDRAA